MAINITGRTSCPPREGIAELCSAVSAKGNPEKKLKWAFKMYDIDSNGGVDRQEMLKIIEVGTPMCLSASVTPFVVYL